MAVRPFAPRISFIIAAVIVAACGGGADRGEAPLADARTDVTSATPVAPAARYSWQVIPYPGGADVSEPLLPAGDPGTRPHNRVVNRHGQVIGQYTSDGIAGSFAESGFLFDPVTQSSKGLFVSPSGSRPLDLTDSGVAGGHRGFRGFVWSSSTQESVLLGADGQSTSTAVQFLAESGIAGGLTDTPVDPGDVPQPTCDSINLHLCTAFHWDGSTFTKYPGFMPVSMNNAATMVGYYQSAGGPRTIAKLALGGAITPVPAASDLQELGAIVNVEHIDDDGRVFVTVHPDDGSSKTMVVSGDTATEIGQGVARFLERCQQEGCIEARQFTGFSAGGHVIGLSLVLTSDTLLATFAFHWSPADGTSEITIDGMSTKTQFVNAIAINKQGTVIGVFAASATEAPMFIWSKQSGGVRLDTLLANSPIGMSLSPIAIGDGGHILASGIPSGAPGRLVLLTPEDDCLP